MKSEFVVEPVTWLSVNVPSRCMNEMINIVVRQLLIPTEHEESLKGSNEFSQWLLLTLFDPWVTVWKPCVCRLWNNVEDYQSFCSLEFLLEVQSRPAPLTYSYWCLYLHILWCVFEVLADGAKCNDDQMKWTAVQIVSQAQAFEVFVCSLDASFLLKLPCGFTNSWALKNFHSPLCL